MQSLDISQMKQMKKIFGSRANEMNKETMKVAVQIIESII